MRKDEESRNDGENQESVEEDCDLKQELTPENISLEHNSTD